MQAYPFIFVLFIGFFSAAQDFSLYEKHYYNAPELNLPYRLLRPAAYNFSRKYPLLIFLHGPYEKGFDNEAQLSIGGAFFLRDSIRKNYPAFVLFPQCPEIDTWAYFETAIDSASGKAATWDFPFRKKPTEVSVVLKKLVDSIVRAGEVDPSKIYIGGLSQGGMGVLDLIARYPQTFAAAFSICGAGNVSTSKRFAGKVSLWLFHGNDDDIVPNRFSASYYKKLLKAGADVQYSEYPNVKHNSWTNAFNEPALLNWIFSKRKKEGE
jgi:predicted peptidase